MREIKFYKTGDAYGEFSNFASFPISIRGLVWPTSEHYFQAQKFSDHEYREAIRNARTSMQAAQMGRDRAKRLRDDWDFVKEGIMLEALREKFSQHEELAKLLISTGDAFLIEHTENDSYWGDGGDGSGLNRLGILLMQVRDEMKMR